jgi:hypothetical protein
MNFVRAAVKEIVGLFLDDELLAVALLIVVGIVAVLAKTATIMPLAAGALLLGGCIAALMISVWRGAQAR